MKRRAITIVLSVVFLLNAFDLQNARPLKDLYHHHEAAIPTASAVDSADHEPRGNNRRLTEFKRPSRLAGDPKWVTSNIIPNLKRKQRTKIRNYIPAHERGVASLSPGKPRDSVPAKPSRDAALFIRREALLHEKYRRFTGRDFYVTDRQRTPRTQAIRIVSLIRRYGISHVVVLYRSRPAIKQVVSVYKLKRRSRQLLPAMTRIIETQVRRGIFLSNHMRWRAIDVRSKGRQGARLSALRHVARSIGARVYVERDHFHVDLP